VPRRPFLERRELLASLRHPLPLYLVLHEGSSPGTGIIRMMPHLIITERKGDEGLKLLEETCKKFGYPKKY
jgi:hypothetical protein